MDDSLGGEGVPLLLFRHPGKRGPRFAFRGQLTGEVGGRAGAGLAIRRSWSAH
jgi:hypothetical protein